MHRLPIRQISLMVVAMLAVYLVVRIALDVTISELRTAAQDATTTLVLTDGSAFRAEALMVQASNFTRQALAAPRTELNPEHQRIIAFRARLVTLDDDELVAAWLAEFAAASAATAPYGESLDTVPGARAHLAALRAATAELHRIEQRALDLRATDSATAYALLDSADYLVSVGRFHSAINAYRDIVSGAAEERVRDTQARLSQMLTISRTLSLLWIAFGLWLLWLVWWRMLRPLKVLAHQAMRIGAGDYHARNTLRVDATEFGQLARVMNEMSAAVEETVSRLADEGRTDSLTGLRNRRELHDRLATEIARIKRAGGTLCVAMLDLDHFKRINDEYSHQAGDAVLCALAETLRREIRITDLALRVGGEEFVVISPDTDADAAEALLQRVRAAVAAMRVEHDGVELPPITISIGFVEVPVQVGDPERALAAADAAMYEAKRSGRDRVVRYGGG